MHNYFTIKNLSVNYNTVEGSKNILNIDRLNINKGQTYGIVGESGAGKTVLALTILGLLAIGPGEIKSGQILLEHQNLLSLPEKALRKIRGSRIAMIFQDPMSTLNPVFTIGYQLIQIIKTNQKLNEKQAEAKALELLTTVQLSDTRRILSKYPHQLSGGQRQRAIIAMALSCGAEFIIADEPTRNLDVTIQAGILKLLKELQAKLHVTILFIANNLGLVSAMCDQVGILQEGKIIEQGDVKKIMHNPREMYTKTLLQAITPAASGAEIREDPAAEKYILEVSALKKYFPLPARPGQKQKQTVKAVDGIDLKIKKGEILGIVGESGCGKSTLVNTILFLHPPTQGKVVFAGQDIFKLNKKELRRVRKDVQIVFQDPFWSLNPRWLVKDIIGEPLKVHEKLSADGYIDRVQELLQLVGLAGESAFMYPHEFSGGERQRIAIARALSVNPGLIVLDEPTSSIDVLSQATILDLLRDLKQKLGLTYILISHDLGVVNYMADAIIVMYLGKIIEYGNSRQIFKNPRHPYTRALLHSIPDIHTRSIDELSVIEGEIASAINPPPGCRFHPRCQSCMQICTQIEPQPVQDQGNTVCCHLYTKQAGKTGPN